MNSIWEDEKDIIFPTKAVKPDHRIIVEMELKTGIENKKIADAKRYCEIEFPQTELRVCVNNECRNEIKYDWEQAITKYKKEDFKMSHANWKLLVKEAKKDDVTLFQEDWSLTAGKVEDGIKGGKVYRHAYEIKKKEEEEKKDIFKSNTKWNINVCIFCMSILFGIFLLFLFK